MEVFKDWDKLENAKELNELISFFDLYKNNQMKFENFYDEVKYLYYCGFQISNARRNETHFIVPDTDAEYMAEYCYLKIRYLINNESFEDVPEKIIDIKYRALVNLGANYADEFRTISALGMFYEALDVKKNDSMAINGIIFTLERHHSSLDFHGHSEIFNYLKKLVKMLNIDEMNAVSDVSLDDDVKRVTAKYDELNGKFIKKSWYSKNSNFTPMGPDNSFEYWCVHNKLFMNNVVDIGEFREACFDINIDSLIPPSESKWKKSLIGLFDNYILEREQVFKNLSLGKNSYMALSKDFLWLYGFYDKSAYIVAKYFDLEISDRNIDIHTIWDKFSTRYNKRLIDIKNVYLFDLYWLRREERSQNFKGIIDPQSSDMDRIRNIIEHRYIYSEKDIKNTDIEKLKKYVIRMLAIVRHLIMDIIQMITLEEVRVDNDSIELKISEF